MRKQRLQLLFLLLLWAPVVSAVTVDHDIAPPNVQAVLDTYLLPDGDIKETLDEMVAKHNLVNAFWHQSAQEAKGVFREAGFSFMKGCRITEHPSLPGLVLKLARPKRKYQHVSRVWVAETIRGIIRAHDLKKIIIPEKFLYHLPGTPTELSDNNYAVLSEKINVLSNSQNRAAIQQLPIETIQELATVITEAVFNDPSPTNIRVLPDKEHVAIIDTEKIHWKRSWSPERCLRQFKTYLSAEQKKALEEEGK